MNKQFVCEVCEKEFVKNVQSKRITKTCSKECLSLFRKNKYEKNRVDVYCRRCGKKERVPESRVRSYIACSKKCSNELLKRRYKGRKQSKEWKDKITASKFRDKIIQFGVFNCENCNKEFSTNTSLRAHKATCGKEKKIICKICNQIFKYRSGLSHHMLIYHDMKKNVNRSQEEIDFEDKLKNVCEDDIISGYKIDNVNHIYDFYIINKHLIIEYDGDYWHGNEDKFVLTQRMKKQKYVDEFYTQKAIKNNYEICRIYGSLSTEFLEDLRKGEIEKWKSKE